MKGALRILLTLASLALFSLNAWALSLQDAKARGLVGEQPNGYLGIVTGGAGRDVQSLVADINRQRNEAYQEKARKIGVELQIIELRIGQRLIERAEPGHYVQTPDGRWTRR